MNLEHLGLNHPDPVAAAKWYCAHLEMQVARKFGPPGNGHFLADARGTMMLEFYVNSKAKQHDFHAFDPFGFHIAFHVADVAATRERLLKAGAKAVTDVTTNDDGDRLVLVRDPWGLPLQFVTRAKRMV